LNLFLTGPLIAQTYASIAGALDSPCRPDCGLDPANLIIADFGKECRFVFESGPRGVCLASRKCRG